MKLCEGVYLVGSGDLGIGLTHPLDCNVYILTDGNDAVMIDAGVGLAPELILAEIEKDGINTGRISHLLLTHGHADHAGGAAWFREKLNLSIVAPKGEADMISTADEIPLGLDVGRAAGYYPADYKLSPCPVDKTVSPGETLTAAGFSIRVFDASGHSPSGVCYYLSKDGGLLFCGDLLSYGGYISLQSIPGADVLRYNQSVRGLAELTVKSFFPGHLLFSLSNGYRHLKKAADAFSKLGIPPNVI
ncbi:MAG: MBL fold metallo-hydrolase [Oscillospiraceae bacterium]|nr:MBL fold metallo-hydrolase [Oscillospiraceae bacterium]